MTMKVNGTPYRSIWLNEDGHTVDIIDQTRLPHEFVVRSLHSPDDAAEAISVMRVRGAPLIGATAAYGLALAMREDPSDAALARAREQLLQTRPTASNLRWALERVGGALAGLAPAEREPAAYALAAELCDEDAAINRAIGEQGLRLIRDLWQRREGGQEAFHILTHCNAGWLATVDWGTALAPIYKAHDAGIPVHVWVDETRPRNQGAALTAWELQSHGVPLDVIVDNAGGHLMQRGLVDMVITGTDRTVRSGDVCNKIGTYLVALAAGAARIPFYAAVPSSSIDWSLDDWGEIPIEERPADEVRWVRGRDPDGALTRVAPGPSDGVVRNVAFDVTPARLVTGLITERGVCTASRRGLLALFPERRRR
jgi:methylthioribose-1-phosphate isomerase